MTKKLFMETTAIPAQRTAGQIQELLIEAGARSVVSETDGQRKITALAFDFDVQGRLIPFRLPIRAEAIYKLLRARRKRYSPVRGAHQGTEEHDREQADRIAWRQVLRWLEAQVALIETEMVSLPEVMLPYMQLSATQTLYQRLEAGGFDGRMLAAPKQENSKP
jgi:hypothetical protein